MDGAERAVNYRFKDKKLLKRALTLASADADENNQTLEFFGDAILEFIVSEKIFEKDGDEGRLTERRKALVSDGALAPVSKRLGLDKYLIKGANDNNNKKAVPSVYEAMVAAIYLDGGLSAAKKFVYSTLDFGGSEVKNYKGELQELLQSRGERPSYERRDIGTPQIPDFEATVIVSGNRFCGRGGTVKEAEQAAAHRALEYLKENG